MWRQFGATFFFAHPAYGNAAIAVNGAVAALFFEISQPMD